MNWKLFALASCIITVLIFPIMSIAYHKFYVNPWLESVPPFIAKYLGPRPFFSTYYGSFTLTVWLFIGSVWLILGLIHYRAKLKKEKIPIGATILLILSLIVGFYQLNIVEARWNWRNEVDVLAMGDEEFMAHPEWKENAENMLQSVNDDRYADSHITFRIRGWLDWDSTDATDWVVLLYQEAIVECGLPKIWVELVPGSGDYGWGLVSGSEWTEPDGAICWIDHLLIFTGQYMQHDGESYNGLSVPPCNATIIRYDHVDLYTLTHELGHQYYLEHCSDAWCVMNVEYQFGDNFCSDCRAKLNANRDKWITDPRVYFQLINEQHGDDVGGEFLSPIQVDTGNMASWYFLGFGRYRWGTPVTIQYKPKTGYVFDYCHVVNAPYIFTQDPDDPPPPSFNVYVLGFDFVLNDTWTFTAFFKPKPPPPESNGDRGVREKCPTLLVWNGNDYVDYGVIDIHNPSGEDVVRAVPIQAEDVDITNNKAKFRLREGWEGLEFSESVIDQVKLYIINEDGKQKRCRLLSAEHSRLGDVQKLMVASDDVKVQILLLETIDLTFKVPEDVQGFTFVIEGCNMIKWG